MFNTFGVKNILYYYIISFFAHSWFIQAAWLAFWLRYVNQYEVGVFDAIAFGIGFLMEIPSGALADLWGRKKTTAIGIFMTTFGVIMMGFGINRVNLFISNIILLTGIALISGALEAIAYDSLKEQNKEKHFSNVVSKGAILETMAAAFATFVAAGLSIINDRLTFFACGIFFFIAFIVSLKIKEPQIDTYKFNLHEYKEQVFRGFHNIFSKKLFLYSLGVILPMTSYVVFSYGFVRPQMGYDFGFTTSQLSIVFASFNIFAVLVLIKFDVISKFLGEKDINLILILLHIFGFSTAAIITNNLFVGFFAMFAITLAGRVGYPFASIIINRHSPSSERATTLSTLSMVTKMPYFVFAPLLGYLANKEILYFYYLVLIFILVGFLLLRFRWFVSK